MKRSAFIYAVILICATVLSLNAVSVMASDNQRVITRTFEDGKYEPIIALRDIGEQERLMTVDRDGSVEFESSAECLYQKKAVNHNKFLKMQNKQKFVVSRSGDAYTIEEFGGDRILTKVGDKFVFDYPKRDKYGRFIIEDRHRYTFEWSEKSKGWSVSCVDGGGLQIGDDSVFEIVQVNYSKRY